MLWTADELGRDVISQFGGAEFSVYACQRHHIEHTSCVYKVEKCNKMYKMKGCCVVLGLRRFSVQPAVTDLCAPSTRQSISSRENQSSGTNLSVVPGHLTGYG